MNNHGQNDNADDFLSCGIAFQQSWLLLGSVEVPPSVEVFEHGYIEANKQQPHVTPVGYAQGYVKNYERKGEGKNWYRYSQIEGRLIPS